MVWGFVGAVGSTFLIYILPPAFYLRVRDSEKRDDVKVGCAYFVLVTGFLLLLVGLYNGTMNMIQPIRRTSHLHVGMLYRTFDGVLQNATGGILQNMTHVANVTV